AGGNHALYAAGGKRRAFIDLDLHQRCDDHAVAERLQGRGQRNGILLGTGQKETHQNLGSLSPAASRSCSAASRPAALRGAGSEENGTSREALHEFCPFSASTSPRKLSLLPLMVASPAIGVRQEPSRAARNPRSQAIAAALVSSFMGAMRSRARASSPRIS